MQDKRDITVGVVFDYDELQQACHQLRVVELALAGLVDGEEANVDGSDPVRGLQIMLCDIARWLSPGDATGVDEYLAERQNRLDARQERVPMIHAATPAGLKTRQAAVNA